MPRASAGPVCVRLGTVRCGVGHSTMAVLALLVMAGPMPGRALCEDRCERVVPMLSNLRNLWSRSFKRVGENRVSFEEFMVSLVQASSNNGHSRAHRLGNVLLGLISQYQDCVMACEHPFSKRAADRLPQRPSSSLTYPCQRQKGDKPTSPLLTQLCMTYGP